jgi:hypothetical protein
VPVEVDYSRPFSGSDLDAWEQEYLANVCPEAVCQTRVAGARLTEVDGLVEMEPAELNDPFFAGDETDDWYGLWPDDERVTEELMDSQVLVVTTSSSAFFIGGLCCPANGRSKCLLSKWQHAILISRPACGSFLVKQQKGLTGKSSPNGIRKSRGGGTESQSCDGSTEHPQR